MPTSQITRRGAASCYPWQDCGEWGLLVSANRVLTEPMGDKLDRQVVLRLVVDLKE